MQFLLQAQQMSLFTYLLMVHLALIIAMIQRIQIRQITYATYGATMVLIFLKILDLLIFCKIETFSLNSIYEV